MPDSPRLVLLVDDEEALSALTARILRNAGYYVVETGPGADAIRMRSKLDSTRSSSTSVYRT
jgi:CheY-like chemotaxis protein